MSLLQLQSQQTVERTNPSSGERRLEVLLLGLRYGFGLRSLLFLALRVFGVCHALFGRLCLSLGSEGGCGVSGFVHIYVV